MREKEPNIHQNLEEKSEKGDAVEIELRPDSCEFISYLLREKISDLRCQNDRFEGLKDSYSKKQNQENRRKIERLQKAVNVLKEAGFPINTEEAELHRDVIISPGEGKIIEVNPDDLRNKIIDAISGRRQTEQTVIRREVEVKSFGFEDKPKEVWGELRGLLEESRLDENLTEARRFKPARNRSDLERVVEEGLWSQKKPKINLLAEEERKTIAWDDVSETANGMIDRALAGLPK